jgi:hypothetical protein
MKKKSKTRSSARSERRPPKAEVAGANPAGSTNMTAKELKVIGPKLFGFGWQTRMAEALNVDGSTVRRWVSGVVPIPGPAVAALRCFVREKP